jgi:hypothetical protein
MSPILRFNLICIGGAALVLYALNMRQAQNPEAAPHEVQENGKAILKEQLARIRDTEFAKSERGRVLFERVSDFVINNRIVFTSEILGGEKALCKVDLFGDETWYIEVTKTEDGRYVHQAPYQLAEVAFHEALHSIKGGYNSASVEEECDAFVAGNQAEAASQGVDPQDVVMLEDMPVAKFVEKRYEGITHKYDYEPVGQSMEWLKQRSGL